MNVLFQIVVILLHKKVYEMHRILYKYIICSIISQQMLIILLYHFFSLFTTKFFSLIDNKYNSRYNGT